MDGWESRRKRTPGHDWAVIQLATAGKIAGFDIDTNFFLGNHPPHASIEAAYLPDASEIESWEDSSIEWVEILPKSHLDAGSQNFYACAQHSDKPFTHLRLHIYPDGGVARLRVYGEVVKDLDLAYPEGDFDLLAAINGGKALACNDMFFSAMSNLTMPRRGANMGDGWETKRNRTPNNRDWVILKLARAGEIHQILVDTCHFKGNYPDTCSVEACFSTDDQAVLEDKANWVTVLPKQKLSADAEHFYVEELENTNAQYTHVRLNIFPDGGVSRLRVFGR
jgi:allantoicase